MEGIPIETFGTFTWKLGAEMFAFIGMEGAPNCMEETYTEGPPIYTLGTFTS
jgi:hypothetical protein